MSFNRISFLILITLIIFGCDKKEADDMNLLSIDLMTEDDPIIFAKTVILFESSEFLIKTTFDTYIESYPFNVLYGYDEIKLQAIQDSKNQEILEMSNYLKLPIDSTYVLAYHLENGSCLIYDKKVDAIIPNIEMEKYSEGEPMMSTRGRRFYINGQLFLEVVDMIS